MSWRLPEVFGRRDDRKHVVRVANQARCVRREVRNLTVMGMDPKQPPDQAALIKDLEQSARVEMRLRSMALAHAKGTAFSWSTEMQQRDAITSLAVGPIK